MPDRNRRAPRGVPFRRPILVAGVAVILCFLWEVGCRALNVPAYLAPPPSAIAQRLVAIDGTILSDVGATFIEALLGFAIGSGAGMAIGISFVLWRPLESALLPYVVGLRAVPIIAIAPLLVLWFGNGIWSKVMAAALLSFFAPLVNTLKGMRSFSEDYADLFRCYGASRLQTVLKLRIPWSLPYVFASLKMAATLAVVGAIVGEFVGADRGIGHAILLYSYRLDTAGVFSALVLTALLSVLLFAIVVALERFLVYWPTEARNDT